MSKTNMSRTGSLATVLHPDHINRSRYRYYLVGLYIHLFGFVSHLGLFFLFMYLGVTEMWLFNIGSMAVFLFSAYTNWRGWFCLSFFPAFTEVILHAALATHLTGWNTGFHYFIFLAGTGVYFTPCLRKGNKLFLMALTLAVYLVLAGGYIGKISSYQIDSGIVTAVNFAIISGTFVALAFFGYYSNQAAAEVEEKLEAERSLLEERNRMVEKELELAHRIQMQYIPGKSPLPGISFYYKSMDQLGGDFFDFFQLPSGKIGIFLSDVSGHGTPAAFVTTMVKGFALQHSASVEDPGDFLTALNGFLQNLTGGNFITAFYAVYDYRSRQLVYANAGHNLPLLIHDSLTEVSSDTPGPPLVVFSPEELRYQGREYVSSTIRLAQGNKLLLYTDGLVEAVNMLQEEQNPEVEHPDFGSREFERILLQSREASPELIINKLVENLVAFRGSDHFADDICIICMES